ncbi:hypothetical protein J6590_040346 [Homalodisca vitripennis]|nr:hypothetical protein J6590_040346 [Homalodisca vitripennis]
MPDCTSPGFEPTISISLRKKDKQGYVRESFSEEWGELAGHSLVASAAITITTHQSPVLCCEFSVLSRPPQSLLDADNSTVHIPRILNTGSSSLFLQKQNYIAQCSGSESLNLLSVLTMDNVESNKIPTRVSRDHGVCALCLLSNMEHTGVYDRGLWLSEVGDRDFQQATSETTRSIQQTANSSSRIYIRPEPALVRWKMAVRGFSRDVESLCSVAVGTPCLCFVYGFVFLTLTFYLSHLIFKGIFSILLFLLLVSLITVMSLALPIYCWRSGILDRLESRTRRRQFPTTLGSSSQPSPVPVGSQRRLFGTLSLSSKLIFYSMDSETKIDISAHCELHCTECRQISSSRSSQMPTENSWGTNCANRSFIGNIFKCRGTYRGLCARTRAAMSKCVREIKQSVVKYVTSLVRFVKNSAGVLLFCGIIILCVFDLVMLHHLAVHSMEAYAVLLFTPLFVIWLPAFAWKIGCFNLCCGSHEDKKLRKLLNAFSPKLIFSLASDVVSSRDHLLSRSHDEAKRAQLCTIFFRQSG